VRGYKEEGTTTTPFDMVVLNNLDRYQLALDAIRRIPRLTDQVESATARYWTTMERHKLYVSENGDDMPEVHDCVGRPEMGAPPAHVLALNSGSSSLKFGLYGVGSWQIDMLLSGAVEATRQGAVVSSSTSIPNLREAILRIAARLADSKMPTPVIIGHRIEHGGPKLRRHCLIDPSVLRQLEAATAFAPLHIPLALSVIRFAQELFPGLPQVACFDTTFHADLAEVARVLPIDKKLQVEGIQRYGFHGLSCESIVRQLGKDAPRRLIVAHLGNGASVTAVKDGKSFDTSMGLTPSGGAAISTRACRARTADRSPLRPRRNFRDRR
jgi:acetate kinase